MSRRRTARTDVHAWTPEDDPTTQPVGRAAVEGDEPCPGSCNRSFRKAENAALDLAAARLTAHQANEHAGMPCPDDCPQDIEPVPDHNIPFHPGRPIWCVDIPAFNDRGEMLPTLAHRGCTRHILGKLRDLPNVAGALTPGRLNTPRDTDVDPSTSTGGGARTLSHAPSPSPGWDTADEIIRWALTLEDWLRDHLDDHPTETRRPAILRVRHHTLPPGHHGPTGPALGYRGTVAPTTKRTLAAAITYLHRHGTALLASPDAARIGQDILDTHRRLEHLVGHDRLTHHLRETCPRCGRRGLRRNDGDDLVRCNGCSAVWDWDHLRHLTRVLTDQTSQRKSS